MQIERIGLDHLNGFAALVDAVAVIELDCAQIRKKQNIRSEGSDLKCLRQGGILDRGALGSQAHSHSLFLSGQGQGPVNLSRLLSPPGH